MTKHNFNTIKAADPGSGHPPLSPYKKCVVFVYMVLFVSTNRYFPHSNALDPPLSVTSLNQREETDTLFLMAVNTNGNREEIKPTLNAYTTDMLDPAKYFLDTINRIIRHIEKKIQPTKIIRLHLDFGWINQNYTRIYIFISFNSTHSMDVADGIFLLEINQPSNKTFIIDWKKQFSVNDIFVEKE